MESATAETQILDHCLIRCVFPDKQVPFNYLKEHMGHIWRPLKRVTITKTDSERFLFQFNHRLDVSKVLERIASGVVPTSVNLNHLDIWVQVHQLPFSMIQPRVGSGIGELIEYDLRNTIHISYMRPKVRIS